MTEVLDLKSFTINEKMTQLTLPKTVNLNIPFFSQRDNKFSPSNTCNVTCVAMCLYFFGVRPKLKMQLEDELFLEVQKRNWDKYTHDHLDKLFDIYGIENRFSVNASWGEIKQHLANGNPVIISGKFTKSGHIIVLRGYDEKGFFVNDPWGEWFSTGYQAYSGESLHYSYNLCYRLSYGGEKTCWAHFPQQRKQLGKLPLPGVELIKQFEGCYLEAYPDPLSGGKPYTIGWGSTLKRSSTPWKLGEKISQSEADDLLTFQLERDYLPPLEKIPVWGQLNTNQRGALLSFGYNLGANFYDSSGFTSITAMLKNQDWSIALPTFIKYRNPGSVVEAGLRRRRMAEADLFLKPE